MGKKRKAPEVLHRAYGTRARTLADTILLLVPPPASSAEECRCKGRVCLGCRGAAARSFLMRDGDNSDYIRLLTQAYAVIIDNAPPVTAFYPEQRWQQRNIVRNTIEVMMNNSTETSNVICSGYDKRMRFSPIADALCTSAWSCLLSRIGDDLMVHLLKYASIFLSLSSKNLLQVTGPPISKSVWFSNTSKYKTLVSQLGSKHQKTAHVAHHFESGQQKRKIETERKRESDATIPVKQCRSLFGIDKSAGPVVGDVGGKPRKHVRPFSWQRRRMRRRMNFPEENVMNDCAITADVKENSNGELQQSSNGNLSHHVGKPISLVISDAMTQISTPRETKFLSGTESSSLRNGEAIVANIFPSEHSGRVFPEQATFPILGRSIDSDSMVVRLKISELKEDTYSDNFVLRPLSLTLGENSENQYERSYTKKTCADSPVDLLQKVLLSQRQESEKQHITLVDSKKVTSHCFNCLMLQAPQKHQIKRQSIFYCSNVSRSLFPRNHILNRLKPNDAGAISLLKHIFSLPDEYETTNSLSCIESNSFCTIKSNPYNSLLGPLKTLIRKAQRCQHLKLLHKHCSDPTLGVRGDRGNRYVSKEDLMQKKMSLSLFRVLTLRKKYAGLQSSKKLSSGESYGLINQRQEKLPTKRPKVYAKQFGLSGSYCKHKQVVSFVWAVCRGIIPLDLLGDPSNWRASRKNISKFVQLRRFENFCLKQCVLGIKVSCFPLILKVAESSYCLCNHGKKDAMGKGINMLERYTKSCGTKTILTKRLFERWIFWFFSCLVVPLVHANFYVTENEAGRQDMFYYKKSVWKKLMNKAIDCLEERNYHLLDHKSFGSILRKRSFGFSKVRFLPKENGVRPLANLKAPSKVWLSVQELVSKNSTGGINMKTAILSKSESYSRKWKLVHFKPVNSVLRDLYAVLRRVKDEHPEKLGSSVFDYNDIYKKLCPFLFWLRKGSVTMLPVFIVVGDVSKAFDSVKHDKLLSVMKEVLCSDKYILKRYAQVVCTKESLRVCYNPLLVDQSIGTDVTKNASCIPFSLSHCVLIDQVRRQQIKQDTLYHHLEEHVKRNILQLGRNFFLQEVGIPQGSVLSSLLCSFYFGHLERKVIFPLLEKTSEPCTIGCDNHWKVNVSDQEPVEDEITCLGKLETATLKKTNILCLKGKHGSQNDDVIEKNDGTLVNDNVSSPKYMLLRLIDDFLFVSTSKEQALSFFSRLRRGFNDYNCSMNNDKFCINFDVENQSQLLWKRGYTGEDGVSFLPWGGLLVNCDTLEIQADYTRYWGMHMSSTLTVWGQDKPGFHLKMKLCDYMRPKCHPIFYDSNINSPATVRVNAYQAFLLCAMKFHCYVCAVPNTGSLSPSYYLEIILRSLRYMYKLLKKRMHGIELTSNLHPILQLKKEELEWLGLSAYVRVLRKKQSRHTELLSMLRSKGQTYGRMAACTSADLKYAVNDSHSSLFWKIKY